MQLRGHVSNGQIVLDENFSLPEGAPVTVTVPDHPKVETRNRLQFPIIPSRQPGTIALTNEQIGEILEREDVPVRH